MKGEWGGLMRYCSVWNLSDMMMGNVCMGLKGLRRVQEVNLDFYQ
jgi:hypothetical protein